MYQTFVRPLLFHLEPEQAHALTIRLLQLAGRLAPARALLRRWFTVPETPVEVLGLRFPNAVGLAAGYDKDGLGWRGLACLGFGHIEVGTVTLRPQEGNPRPRLFRLPAEEGLINRMGFPGRGADFVRRQLSGPRPDGLVLGANLGKNKETPLEEAAADYLALMEYLAPAVDYLAINVSSPNTVGLRRLQARAALEALLGEVSRKRQEIVQGLGRPVPVLVKLAPDLEPAELDDALQAILATGMDGVIAANTTLSREGLRSPQAKEAGGLSGAPLRQRSTHMVRAIHQRTGGKLPIIGVGGIDSPVAAREKLDAGATLVQIYTGLIYQGPGVVKEIRQSV
jgi:dihydroorotate dehydrogenase